MIMSFFIEFSTSDHGMSLGNFRRKTLEFASHDSGGNLSSMFISMIEGGRWSFI